MKMIASSTKEKIMISAIYLFNTKGYHGTAIRDISKRAKVNASNISYHFNGKQGLLEECFTRFFEPYLAILEKEVYQLDIERADVLLLSAIKKVLHFQSQQYQLARLVWREVSVDSQVVREIFSSYLMKERYYLKAFFEKGMQQGIFSPFPVSYAVIHLKSLLSMPYINQQYMEEVWNLYTRERLFTERYFVTIQQWLTNVFIQPNLLSKDRGDMIVNR
ncbi:forespore capture DNA-binding protein RefZ [Bacillus sp. 2205SS5-2]|uniref:forespore capture DNA-binding protein RefZ n=1 Tax=Bacillus sp. 2205SS5-2 TaxID=3109031 RepID=UPI0030074C55